VESQQRDILSQVAAGALSPEEAAARLHELERRDTAEPGAVRRVRVVRQMGPAEVVGDPSVREVTVEGPHNVRREGDLLVVCGESELRDGGFSFGREAGRFALHMHDGPHQLLVRMNPALALEATVTAGTFRVRGVTGPIRAEVQAGSTRIEGAAGPLELSVQAGSLRAGGRILDGTSHIRCEAGSVHLHLERGSSARVVARTTLGKISLPRSAAWIVGAGGREATIGTGRATIDIETTMGTVRVTSDE